MYIRNREGKKLLDIRIITDNKKGVMKKKGVMTKGMLDII